LAAHVPYPQKCTRISTTDRALRLTDTCMLAATARAEQWGASPGDVVRCRVELVHTAPAAADGRASVWVDWLAAQCCGFCKRHSAAAAAEFTTQPNMPSALATSLPDETQAGVPGRTCFLASPPQVVAAGLQLEADHPASFLVSIALPQQQLSPSFAGHAASYEYVLLLTLRTMAPPGGKGVNPSAWKRGPICRLRLPLRVMWVAGAAPSRSAMPSWHRTYCSPQMRRACRRFEVLSSPPPEVHLDTVY